MALINLHNHSAYSDGTLAPEAVAREAELAGITFFALTDHDTVGGSNEIAGELKARGIAYCHGVEITTSPRNHLHILGYGINPKNPLLLTQLARFREIQVERVKKALQLLKPLGIEIDFKDLPWRGGCPPTSHQIAEVMVARNMAPRNSFAYKHFLGVGAPAYVERSTPTVEEAIKAIRAAGGKAVLAHPYTVEAVMDLPTWKEAGLEGIEAFYPAHTDSATREFLDLAKHYGLFVTAGTDFHGPGTERDKMSGYESAESHLAQVMKLFF